MAGWRGRYGVSYTTPHETKRRPSMKGTVRTVRCHATGKHYIVDIEIWTESRNELLLMKIVGVMKRRDHQRGVKQALIDRFAMSVWSRRCPVW